MVRVRCLARAVSALGTARARTVPACPARGLSEQPFPRRTPDLGDRAPFLALAAPPCPLRALPAALRALVERRRSARLSHSWHRTGRCRHLARCLPAASAAPRDS